MSAKYVVNGKEYASIEPMPAEIRSVYRSLGGLLADADNNGIPDIMDGRGARQVSVRQTLRLTSFMMAKSIPARPICRLSCA